MQYLEHLIGTTFCYAFAYEIPAGTWNITSSIADENLNHIDTLEVVVIPPSVGANLSKIILKKAANQQSTWPVNALVKLDVRFSNTSVFNIPGTPVNFFFKRCVTNG